MLEEEPRLVMDDMFANVDERKLGGLQHVSSDWPEWQQLDVDGVDIGKMGATARSGDCVHQLLPAVRSGWGSGWSVNLSPFRSIISLSYQPIEGKIAARLGNSRKSFTTQISKSR